MEKGPIPIALHEHLHLSAIGIQTASITWQRVKLGSDHFICVRESVGELNQVVIADLADGNGVLRRPIEPDIDSAIMHPREKIIALKSRENLQIYNIETNTRVKSHQLTEEVVFWKWVSEKALGLVTETSVYLWSVSNIASPKASPPQKIFDRDASLAGAYVINYCVTLDERWHVLIGVVKNTNPEGFVEARAMQLYNTETGISQPIKGHAAAFAELKLDGIPELTKLFIFAVRTATSAKLHILKLDEQAPNSFSSKIAVDVFFSMEPSEDFPIAIQISKRRKVIYLVTLYGLIHVYDLESGACIYMNRISGDTIFATSEYEATNGIIMVNIRGQVLSVNIDDKTVAPYILNTLRNTELAFKMESRINLHNSNQQYLSSIGQFSDAPKSAAYSPRDIVRQPQTLTQDDHASTSPLVPLTNDITDSVSLTSAYRVNSGGFGDLFMGHHKNWGKVALKRPHTLFDEPAIRRFLREVNLWCSISNKYVLPCLGMCRIGPDVYVVSPFIQNGDLLSCMTRGMALNCSKLLYEVAEALNHLHYRGIVHGDLEAQNILLSDDGSALLCDFGLAKAFDSMATSTGAKGTGSIRWMAPELLLGEGRSKASDVYSFGLTISEILSGQVPFHDLKNNVAVMVHLLNFDRRPPPEPLTSPSGESYVTLWEIAEKCWVKSAMDRPIMAQVLAMLFHCVKKTTK